MKVLSNLENNFIIKTLEKFARNSVTFFYGWIFNDNTAILGHILGVVHFMLSTVLVISIILCHTVYPAFWAQCFVYVFIILIWLQHVFLQICFITVAEKKLTKTTSPFEDITQNLFGQSATGVMTNLLIFETAAVFAFGLEIISKIIGYVYTKIGVNIW